jgi:hypothetical protein
MKTIARKNRTAVITTLVTAALYSLSSTAFGQQTDFISDFAPSPLPEPETLALLAIGAVALLVSRWTRRK